MKFMVGLLRRGRGADLIMQDVRREVIGRVLAVRGTDLI